MSLRQSTRRKWLRLGWTSSMGPDAHNRVGSFIGPRAASFQVIPTDAPAQGDLETAELYGRRIAEITRQFVKGR